MDIKDKVRLDNELIEIFINLPKSTNTAMSWLLLHKSMQKSINSKKNLIKFNFLEFMNEYQVENKSWVDNMNSKRNLFRDFQKLENVVRNEKVDENGDTILESFYFFQYTKINKRTLDVEIILNDKIYNSVSSIPETKYFQFLKKEAIMIANKKLTPTDAKLLFYLKSKSHNSKKSFVKVDLLELYQVLGQSTGTRLADIKKRHLDPFIERILANTNYVISYEVQKSKVNKRKISSLLFSVDNRKEKMSIINSHLDKDTQYDDNKAQKYFEELELELVDMENNEQQVKNSLNKKKIAEQLNELETNEMTQILVIEDSDYED